jgi:hypothetical protein
MVPGNVTRLQLYSHYLEGEQRILAENNKLIHRHIGYGLTSFRHSEGNTSCEKIYPASVPFRFPIR